MSLIQHKPYQGRIYRGATLFRCVSFRNGLSHRKNNFLWNKKRQLLPHRKYLPPITQPLDTETKLSRYPHPCNVGKRLSYWRISSCSPRI